VRSQIYPLNNSPPNLTHPTHL